MRWAAPLLLLLAALSCNCALPSPPPIKETAAFMEEHTNFAKIMEEVKDALAPTCGEEMFKLVDVERVRGLSDREAAQQLVQELAPHVRGCRKKASEANAGLDKLHAATSALGVKVKVHKGMGYDLVINNNNTLLSALGESGWPVEITNRSKYDAFVSGQDRRPSVYVGLTGPFNTGKTYLLNLLRRVDALSGFDTETKGLSIMLPDGNDTAVYVDQQGSTRSVAHNKFVDRTASDQFLEDAVCEMSDMVIVVINRLSDREQKWLLKLEENVFSRTIGNPKQLIVVHNLINHHTEAAIQLVIRDEIVKAFNAVEIISTAVPVQTETLTRDGNRVKNWEQKDVPFWQHTSEHGSPVMHVVLAEDSSAAGAKYNRQTLAVLRTRIGAVSPRTRDADPLSFARGELQGLMVDFFVPDGQSADNRAPIGDGDSSLLMKSQRRVMTVTKNAQNALAGWLRGVGWGVRGGGSTPGAAGELQHPFALELRPLDGSNTCEGEACSNHRAEVLSLVHPRPLRYRNNPGVGMQPRPPTSIHKSICKWAIRITVPTAQEVFHVDDADDMAKRGIVQRKLAYFTNNAKSRAYLVVSGVRTRPAEHLEHKTYTDITYVGQSPFYDSFVLPYEVPASADIIPRRLVEEGEALFVADLWREAACQDFCRGNDSAREIEQCKNFWVNTEKQNGVFLDD